MLSYACIEIQKNNPTFMSNLSRTLSRITPQVSTAIPPCIRQARQMHTKHRTSFKYKYIWFIHNMRAHRHRYLNCWFANTGAPFALACYLTGVQKFLRTCNGDAETARSNPQCDRWMDMLCALRFRGISTFCVLGSTALCVLYQFRYIIIVSYIHK